MSPFLRRSSLIFFLVAFSCSCWADLNSDSPWIDFETELLGKISLSDLSLRPEFSLQEGRRSKFSAEGSVLGITWDYDQTLKVNFLLGSENLRYRPDRFPLEEEEKFGFVEAFGEMNLFFGVLRFGLIPVPYGVESLRKESQLIFPRPLIYTRRVINLRDYGFSYGVSNKGFYSQSAIHNGEGGPELDNKLWFTTTLGWRDEVHRAGIKGTTGSTKGSATKDSTGRLGNFDNTKDGKWRMAGFFFERMFKSWDTLVEANIGSLLQDGNATNFATGNWDVNVWLPHDLGLHARYDFFDPRSGVTSDLIQDITLGFSTQNQTGTSQWILLGTKSFEQKRQVANDEVRILWVLRPQVRAR